MNKSIVNLTGELVIVRNEKNSIYGNPRFLCMIGNTAFYTRPNSMIAYGLTNFRNKNVNVALSNCRGKLSLDNIELAV